MIADDAASPLPPTASERAKLLPEQARQRFRNGERWQTSGTCPGFAQANLLAVPRSLAFDMLLFAQRNPKSCPILGVIDAGATTSELMTGGDIRTDLPAYRVYERGELVSQPNDAIDSWQDDLVSFVIGCSYTFETSLAQAGVPMAHIEQGHGAPAYATSVQCVPAGSLHGPLVVSMRPLPAEQISDAVRITSRFPGVHGAPIHIGDPMAIGIADLNAPDFANPIEVPSGWVPVFWACGITPQAVVMESRPTLAISHEPAHMLITDLPDHRLQIP